MAGKKEMDALLSRFVETGPAGCGCIVTKDGERIYENYFGYENVEEKKPIDADTIYRQYSMTKVIICTAAMKLFESETAPEARMDSPLLTEIRPEDSSR